MLRIPCPRKGKQGCFWIWALGWAGLAGDEGGVGERRAREMGVNLTSSDLAGDEAGGGGGGGGGVGGGGGGEGWGGEGWGGPVPFWVLKIGLIWLVTRGGGGGGVGRVGQGGGQEGEMGGGRQRAVVGVH